MCASVLVPLLFLPLAEVSHASSGSPARAERQLFVAPGAAPEADGSRAHPFPSIEAARDRLRAERSRSTDAAPERPAIVLLGGTWPLTASVELDHRDSDLILRAAAGARPRLVGGIVLAEPRLEPLTDDDLLARLPNDAARSAVRVVRLPPETQLAGPVQRGMGSPTVPIASEVFLDGIALRPARWPNEGFCRVGEVFDPGSVPRNRADDVPLERRETGPERGGRFRPAAVEAQRLARWAAAEEPWAFGYWFHDWADEQLPIEAIDPEAGTLQLALPHRYGLRAGTGFYVTHLIEELDAPGEYHLDRAGKRLLLWPPESRPIGELIVSTLGDPLLRVRGARGILVEGLTFEGTRGGAVVVEEGEEVILRGCRIVNTGADGVRLDGVRCAVLDCDLRDVGGTGVSLLGGDRRTLTPGGNRLEGSRLHRFGRVWRTYRPGASIDGVGQLVRGNELAHAPHSAILFGGNEHRIEGNEIFDVLRETGDCGAIYCGRDWTMHGNRVTGNFIHHLGGSEGRWQNAIYLDDMASGIEVSHNVIWRCHWGMLIGGGRDLVIHHNAFLDCDLGIHFDARGVGWMAPHIADPETSTLHRRLAEMPIASEPWSSRYPSLAHYLDDRFGRPAGSRVESNRFYGTPFGSVADRECVRVAGNREQATLPEWIAQADYVEEGRERGARRGERRATSEVVGPLVARTRPAEVVLVEDGRSDWTIVVPDEATAAEEFAATELARHLERIAGGGPSRARETDAPAQRRIFVGATGAAREEGLDGEGLGEDGFTIRFVERADASEVSHDLFLVAGPPEGGPHEALGVLYAVYHLLETQLGCRFWAPGALEIPQRSRVSLPAELAISERPRIWFRQVNYGPANDADYRRWHKLDRVQEEVGRLWAPRWVHSAFAYVNPEEHFETHPEYFALVGDRRAPSQLCLTNPEVLQLVVAGLERVLDEHTGVRYVSFSQEDNYGACSCAGCVAIDAREGTRMGSLLTFVNALADAFPELSISTLAYQYSRKPPRTLRPRENVSIMLCTIEEDRARPIADNPESEFAADFEGWSALSDDIFLWDYEVQFASPVAPFPNLRVLGPNVRWFAERGVRHLFLQGNGLRTELAELRCYLLAKLAWNPELDVEATIDEFLTGFYGEAAPHLRAYLDLLHDELEASGEVLFLYGNPSLAAGSWLRPEVLERARTLFDRAAQAVAGQPERAERVRTARLPLMYAELEIAKRRGARSGGIWERVDGSWRVRYEVERLLDDFLAGCRAAGIGRLREMDLTLDEYRAAWQRLLDPDLPQHAAFGRPVHASPPPSAKYSGGAVERLVDGLPGGDLYIENWVGWEGTGADVVLDLTGLQPSPTRLTLSALQDPKSWIWLPRVIEVEVSGDGTNWCPLARLEHRVPEQEGRIQGFEVDLGQVSGPITHLRLVVDALETCPSWHHGAGEPAWFFIDELRVE